METIKLKRSKTDSLLRKHPWIFSGAIHSASGDIEDGDLVTVTDYDDNFIAIGHSAIGSIAIRVLSFEREDINQEWWSEKLLNAKALRDTLSFAPSKTNCYRLVHGEGDMLPGLIIDIYNRTAVMQCHSVGMYLDREKIATALRSVYGDNLTAIYDKSSNTLPAKSDISAKNEYLYKATNYNGNEDIIIENNHKFLPNWEEGQKTGFFIDQRDNRMLVQQYAKGRKVLNTFCYTGGFSISALSSGALECTSVDSSERAMALCRENIALNLPNTDNHTEIVADAMQFIKDMPNDYYDLIILDPPAFAKHHKSVPNALQGYKRLNANVIERMPKSSILFTFSCSQAISKEQFRQAIFSASMIAKRNVRILHQLTQPADHPINIYHPESEYLKGLVLFVE